MSNDSTGRDDAHQAGTPRRLSRRELRLQRQQQAQQQERTQGSGRQGAPQLPPPVPAVQENSAQDVPFDQEAPQPRTRREARMMQQQRQQSVQRPNKNTLFDQEAFAAREQQRRQARLQAAAEARAKEEAEREELQRQRHQEKDRILKHIREQNAAWAMPKLPVEEPTPLPGEQVAETRTLQDAVTAADGSVEVVDTKPGSASSIPLTSNSAVAVDEHPEILGYQTIHLHESPDEEHLETRRRRSRRKTAVLMISILLFVVAIIVVAGFIQGLISNSGAKDYTGKGTTPVHFTIKPGEGSISIANRLVEEDIVASSQAFMKALEKNTSGKEIQPGDYELKKQMSASDALDQLLNSRSKVHYIALRSGLRFYEVLQEISKATGIPEKKLMAAARPADYKLPPQAQTLEGFISPGEYRVPIDATPKQIFTELIAPTKKRLNDLGVTDPAKQYRLVTVASILEGEANPKDYAHVAGIIENRLKPGNKETHGYLQIDATVIYGLKERRLHFTEKERKDKSNPYNSYVHKGLPPGPIGAPSEAALKAAAAPEKTQDYYWITTNIETGETKFAKTYQEHQRYQAEFDEYCRKNPTICHGDQ